jgi:hypothetical protein
MSEKKTYSKEEKKAFAIMMANKNKTAYKKPYISPTLKMLYTGKEIRAKLKFACTVPNFSANMACCCISLNNPSACMFNYSSATTNFPVANILPDDMGGGAIYAAGTFGNYVPIYDTMRVRGVKVKVIPLRKVNLSTTSYDSPFETCWDTDNTNIGMGMLGLMDNYGNYKARDGYKEFTEYCKLPKYTTGPTNLSSPYINTNSVGLKDGFYNTNFPLMCGMYYIYQRNNEVANGANAFKVMLCYYVSFRFRV